MSNIGAVLDWLTSSEANTKRFREDFSVVNEVAGSLSEADLAVLRKIHAHGMLGGATVTAEVMGMRSYGWADTPTPAPAPSPTSISPTAPPKDL